MKVTVLMPVYNAGIYLKDSIEGILNQTFKDFEFLIINDGSTDGSDEILKSYSDSRIRVFHNEKNLGLIATLNKGLALAKGEYIARQDADDISLPHRLDLQVKIMDRDPELLLLSSNAYIIDNNSVTISNSNLPEKEISLRFRMLFKCGIFHTSTIFRKKSLDDFQLNYNVDYPHAEDYKLWSDLSRHGKIRVLEDKLVKYRNHPESISSKNKKQQEELASKVVMENIQNLGVDISLKEATRLRSLFRATGLEKKFLKHDLSLLMKIIHNFEIKYREFEAYDSYEIRHLLKRMVGWISKSDLFDLKFLYLYLYLKYILFAKTR